MRNHNNNGTYQKLVETSQRVRGYLSNDRLVAFVCAIGTLVLLMLFMMILVAQPGYSHPPCDAPESNIEALQELRDYVNAPERVRIVE